MLLMTPWQVPTKSSWRPKSVRKVMKRKRICSIVIASAANAKALFSAVHRAASTTAKTRNTSAMTPLTVKKAAFNLRRSFGETIRCS